MAELTIKQENFCRFYVETGNASEAYRQAYDAENMSQDAIKVEASRLLDHPTVALTIANFKKFHAERHAITVDSLTLELEQARGLAFKVGNPSAAVSASMGKAKIHGLIIDKGEHTGKDGQPLTAPVIINVTSDVVKDEVARLKDEF